ncbi:MAG: hypothetical protein HGJ94_16005, partial [Desulfosarcina sp.]|nr:hypothetical protein [Desulfosarcina sp.]
MKVPIFSGKRSRSTRWTLPLALAVLLLFSGTVALASSDGGHGDAGSKGWVKTDTYRVMNFAVL